MFFSHNDMAETKKAVSQISIFQDWIRNYLQKSLDDFNKDTFFWAALCGYEWGDFLKNIVYSKVRPKSYQQNSDAAHEAFGEVVFALFCLGEKCNIDFFKAMEMTLEKYNNREWRKKK